MKNIFIVPIEPIHTRYTAEWYEHLPKLIQKEADFKNVELDIVVVDGEQVPPVPTPGAFLDFGATNIFKSTQLATIAEQFQHGRITPGDKFLFTDAWNPTVLSVKYMSELLNIPVELHGMWHAGSYDPQDFLGRLIGNKPWVRNSELAMFHSYDTNWFATDFHKNMFVSEIFKSTSDPIVNTFIDTKKIALTGWPMSYLFDVLKPYSNMHKKPQVVFPHRLAPEKQLDIFKDLAASMPEYEWIVCQEKTLTKDQYHQILGESAIVFSANLQETYGISCIEGAICGAVPLVPDRLSYSEMYISPFKYPSAWTTDFSSYKNSKESLMFIIESFMTGINTPPLMSAIDRQVEYLKKYVAADNLINALIK